MMILMFVCIVTASVMFTQRIKFSFSLSLSLECCDFEYITPICFCFCLLLFNTHYRQCNRNFLSSRYKKSHFQYCYTTTLRNVRLNTTNLHFILKFSYGQQMLWLVAIVWNMAHQELITEMLPSTKNVCIKMTRDWQLVYVLVFSFIRFWF